VRASLASDCIVRVSVCVPIVQRVAVLGTQRSRCGNVHSPSAFDNSFCPASVVPGRCSAANWLRTTDYGQL